MIEIVDNKILDLLKENEISLAMIYDSNGKILWHKGRAIEGKTIDSGVGFCKNYIKESFYRLGIKTNGGITIVSRSDSLSGYAMPISIKSLIIRRLNSKYFLYIDSETKESFSPIDCEVFKDMGEILGDTILQIMKNGTEIGRIAGTSESIRKIRELVMTYAMSDEPVLLIGETGTGKTHIAELIHNYSGKKGKFKIINTPGIPESLFESEMFGHKKGAFTDARIDKKGLVEEAAEGTLFIDEISEVSVALQAKLLRFIETGKYIMLGESSEREVDCRIVAATNKDLKKAMEDKEFREDLYYRLNVFEIELPPLRKRKEDIEALVLDKKKYLNEKKIGTGFWESIINYDWPGNVRELISALKRAGVLNKDIITGNDMQDIIHLNCKNRGIRTDNDEINQIWNSIKGGKSFWEVVKKPFLSRDLKRSEVKALISRGLVESNRKYKKLIKLFNLEENDYHRFMRFLHEQDLIPTE
jgi:transcriptional regulator with PAS, ATPase and Fis domain